MLYAYGMEEYPFLNEAVASVLRTQREEHDLSKKRLSELAKIERAYITSLERGEKRPTLNVLFYLSDAFGLLPSDLVKLIEEERRRLGGG